MNTLLRKVGFEVEFAHPDRHILTRLQEKLTQVAEPVTNYGSYRHSTGTAWDLKTDSSCGYEVASPIITTYPQLIKSVGIVDMIKEAGGEVNTRCGLHVHIDMNGVEAADFERVMRFMSRYETAFFLLADASRQNNSFCKKLGDISKVVKRNPANFKQAWYDKHFWLNGTHLRGQGTIEFRLMASHLEPEYIASWVLFLLHTVDYLLKGKKVSWGEAKCSSDRDLLQTMLGQAGFYGPFDSRDKNTAVAARKWAVSEYTKKMGQDDRRVKPLTIAQLAELVTA